MACPSISALRVLSCELAAERGHAEAQYRLGLLQAGGLDPEADPAEAYGWLQLAAQSAQDAPIGLLARAMSEALADRLDKEAIERAEQQVAAFRPATGPADLSTIQGGPRPDDDPAALLALLPRTGCGSPEIQRREDGGVVLMAYAPAGPTANRDHTGRPRRSRCVAAPPSTSPS